MYRLYFLIVLFSVSILKFTWADCPGCVVDLPTGLAEDTLFLSALPDGTTNMYYDQDVSFRMPKTTDPVNDLDPDVPAGFEINEITIIGISNLPPGLSWEANQTNYDPQDETDGCIKFCGTPLLPGFYVLEVTVEAQVFVITQETSFPMEIYIAPAVVNNDGFSMTNAMGCGEVTVSFDNNVPSGGNSGFSYSWDFGNGNTSIDENPQDQTYSQPGTYTVNYQAIVDTTGFILSKVIVHDVDCFDIPTGPDFSTNPDLQVEVRDLDGNALYESDTIWNVDPPMEVFPNLELTVGQQYKLRVIDADSGINGGDDICAEFTFIHTSNGIFSTSDYEVELEIFHPVDTIITSDVVTVYEIPNAPIINGNLSELCFGDMTQLISSYPENNQWFLDGEAMTGETADTLNVFDSGIYQVMYTSADGCTAISEEYQVEFFENPELPEYDRVNNLLSLLESIQYGANISFQWYQDGVAIPGEEGPSYCVLEDGDYTLVVTDMNTGCVSEYAELVVYDPNLGCSTTSTEDLIAAFDLKVFPNPVRDHINVSLNTVENTSVTLRVFDLMGRLQTRGYTRGVYGQNTIGPVMVSELPAGLYLLEIEIGTERIIQKFVKE